MGAQEERLAGNEALFREVNERVAEIAEQFCEVVPTVDPIEFTCECASPACTELIAMTLVEYEAVRRMPTHFALVPGHELAGIERVVDRHPGYRVVEKQDDDAERVATETDPRT